MRGKSLSIDQTVRILQLVLNKLFNHLSVLDLLLLGLTDQLLLRGIIDVPVCSLEILGLLLELRLRDLLRLQGQVHGLSPTLHVGVTTDFVGFEFFIFLVLSSYHSEFLGVILDELRRNE